MSEDVIKVSLDVGGDYIATHAYPWHGGTLQVTEAHLRPETDLVARAICERLFIDWRALRREMGVEVDDE